MEREKIEKVRRSCVVMKDYLNNQEVKEALILTYCRVLVEHFVKLFVMVYVIGSVSSP